MGHEIRSFKQLLNNIDGMSNPQLEAHFGLYEGYVKKLNEIEEKLKTTDRALTNYSFGEFAELKRRYTVPYNGTWLHELYFDNLVNKGNPGKDFEKLITQSYGSLTDWIADVKATGLAVPGWVITALDTSTGRINNIQMQEHHIGFPVNHLPLMVMDTWEHAFFLDFKANRGAYIDMFFKNINWETINSRTEKALQYR